MSYTHLSAAERLEFYKLRTNPELTLTEIAKLMNRSCSTLSRELRRNSVEPGLYLPDTAEQKSQNRRQESKKRFGSVSTEIIAEIKTRLKQYHSPEQIIGRLKREEKIRMSHETLYQMIYANYEDLGKYRLSRHHGVKCSYMLQILDKWVRARQVNSGLKFINYYPRLTHPTNNKILLSPQVRESLPNKQISELRSLLSLKERLI